MDITNQKAQFIILGIIFFCLCLFLIFLFLKNKNIKDEAKIPLETIVDKNEKQNMDVLLDELTIKEWDTKINLRQAPNEIYLEFLIGSPLPVPSLQIYETTGNYLGQIHSVGEHFISANIPNINHLIFKNGMTQDIILNINDEWLKNRKISSSFSSENKNGIFKGIIKNEPIPHLRIFQAKDTFNFPFFQTALLNTKNKINDNYYVEINGKLLFHDGKAIINTSEEIKILRDSIPKEMQNTSAFGFQAYKIETTIQGELIDNSSLFQVDKDIIPPILKAKEGNIIKYYIILGENGESIQGSFSDYLGKKLEIIGRSEPLDDWNIIYINPKTGIKKI